MDLKTKTWLVQDVLSKVGPGSEKVPVALPKVIFGTIQQEGTVKRGEDDAINHRMNAK